MVEYAVLIFEQETPGGLTDVPPELMQARIELGTERIAGEGGGRIVVGLALERTETATTLRGTLGDRRSVHGDQGGLGRHVRPRSPRPRPCTRAGANWPPRVHGAVEIRPLLGFEIMDAR